MKTLIIAEHDNHSLNPINGSVISAGKELGTDVDLLVAGFECQAAAASATEFAGVDRVICVDAESLKHQIAEIMAPLAAKIITQEQYTHVLVAATTFGKNLLPSVAALLDVQAISDVIAIVASDTFKRPIYAGNSIATVKSLDKIQCISVRAAAFQADSSAGNSAPIVNMESGDLEAVTSTFIHDELVVSERPDLSAAKVVFSGGRGMGSAEGFDLLYRLADLTEGAVGASRAAVDAGFVSNDMQVGQTGKIIAPDLYVAVGISGAIQHLAGMKESKVIVAINKDEDAPIFQVADYGLVADLFEALPKLETLLSK